MEKEESDQEILKQAIYIKKDKFRNDVRRQNLYNILKNKRINHFLFNCQTNEVFEDVKELKSIVFKQKTNKNSQDVSQQVEEYNLKDSINKINEICDKKYDYIQNFDKLINNIRIINIYIQQLICNQDVDEQEIQLAQFMSYGGCQCILQFLSKKYDTFPLLQMESISIIGNIFSFNDERILSQFIQSGISAFIMNILFRLSQVFVNQNQKELNNQNNIQNNLDEQMSNTFIQSNDQFNVFEIQNQQFQNQQDITLQEQKNINQGDLLCEIFRTIGNMASESYEYRLELINQGFIRYIQSDQFNYIFQQMNQSQIEEMLFLMKSMIIGQPRFNENQTEQFIPILVSLFLRTDLSNDSLSNCILSIMSYAKYGDNVSRSKMLSNRDVFLKFHELIDFQYTNDFIIIHYSLQTLKEYIKLSYRQAEFIFNLNEDSIFDNLEFYLKDQFIGRNCSRDEIHSQNTDLQVEAIEILHIYISYEDSYFFEQIYEQRSSIIEQMIHISNNYQNQKVNKKSKEFLLTCLDKANYQQQQYLIQLGIIQSIIDIIKLNNLFLIVNALNTIIHIFEVNESKNYQNSEDIQQDYLRQVLDSKYQLKIILESISNHPNCDINYKVNYILDNFYYN